MSLAMEMLGWSYLLVFQEDGLACFLACEEPDEFMLSQLFSLTLVVSAESLSEVTTFGLQVSSHMPMGLADIGSPVEVTRCSPKRGRWMWSVVDFDSCGIHAPVSA
jgi:hypothetical protein